ncbi:MAG TPA: hypothetical protein VHC72_12180, partial [Bryobacteraceae bacterium]|nr:hypothetical protein [Bryobacteraceae bacterium]
QAGRRGGLRGMMARKKIEEKKEEMKDEVARLTALLQRYTSPGSDAMRNLLQKATISRMGSAPDADVKVTATGLIDPSDSFSLVWSSAMKRPVKMEIATNADNKPIRIEIDYEVLPNGPFYAAKTVISVPRKDLAIRMQTYDYMLSKSE